jgi:hypothetical protein
MARNWPRTNFELVAAPSRYKPQPGDVFFCKTKKMGRIVLGRVVHDRCSMFGGDGNEYLLYFYRRQPKHIDRVRHPLKPILLIPPVVADVGGWRRGTFRTIANWPLLPCERLPKHWFMESSADLTPTPDHPWAEFCDEFQHRRRGHPKKGEYWTHSGLANFAAIDNKLSEALGMRSVAGWVWK